MAIYEMNRGDTAQILFTVVDSTNTAQDITTVAKIWFTAKLDPTATDPGTFQKTLGAGIVMATQSGTTLGQFTVTIDPADTSSFANTPQILYYDAQIKTNTGAIITLENGTIKVQPDITRAIS